MILFCILDYKLVDLHHVSEIIRTEPRKWMGRFFIRELNFLCVIRKKWFLLLLWYCAQFINTKASLGIDCTAQVLKIQ